MLTRYYSILDQQYKYQYEGLVFPSVTNILKETKNQTFNHFVGDWKENLILEHGQKKGSRKAELPFKVGNVVHETLEAQFRAFPERIPQFQTSLAKHYLPALNLVEEVIAVELPVYSSRYGYAGSIDAIVKLKDGRTAIFDHKTSNKKKTRSLITDYFLQTAAYALAYYDMTGVIIDTTFVNIIYRSKQGKRNPTRFDSYEIKGLRQQVFGFLDRLERYKAKQLQLQSNHDEW